MRDQNGVPAISDAWPLADVGWSPKGRNSWQIIYVAVVGFVLLAAFLEWFLWLAAFLYCLCKVYQKAEHWSIKLLAVVMIISFTLLRYVHITAWSY